MYLKYAAIISFQYLTLKWKIKDSISSFWIMTKLTGNIDLLINLE